MAAPHGDLPKNLNTGFIESVTTDAFQDAQVGSPKSYNHEFDDALASTSGTFHNNLEPSILSIFKESAAEEAEIQIDVESEASLLSAFSEMLDSVIEDTLSPFDTLPDSKLFMSQKPQDSRARLTCLDRQAVPRVTRSFTSSNSKAASLHSDRQLRPRLHRKTQTATVQRSDGEEEDLSEARRRSVRIFRIESDPKLCEGEQQDEFLPVSLVELVRHMHPYSIRVAVDKKANLRVVQELQEDDAFVDVVGDDDDDAEETLLCMFDASKPSDPGSVLIVPHSRNPAATSIDHDSSQEDLLKMCLPNCGKQKKDVAKALSSRKIKKKVRFALDLASIHIYQVEDEADNGDVPHVSSPVEYSEDRKMSHGDSQTSDISGNSSLVAKTTQNSNTKLKTLSLHEYRLLRQKTLPKEVRKTDYRTKWPSVPETPKELPPIPCIPGYNSSQVQVQPFSNPRSSTRGAVAKSRQNALVRKPVLSVDPPNPITVSLSPGAKILLSKSEKQKVMQKKYDKSQASRTNLNHPAAVQPGFVTQEQSLIVSPKDPPTNCSSTIAGIVKANVSVPSSPMMLIPVQRSLPQVRAAVISHFAEGKQKQSAEEIGIEATDVTSLLEQFETQGLTPPATPPHQIWNPLTTTTLKAKQHEAIKPSPSKTIKIIEPKPLPPSKIQAKPQPSSFIPAPSLFLAFIDHDYCITQDFRLSKERALSDVYMHNRSSKESRNHTSHMSIDDRTSCKTENLSGSVLLSPEASPSRLGAKRTGEPSDTETRNHSRCSCSPSLATRGRTRRRHYHGKYHRYDSSSVSSSRSPSCSSASSCSPPRKRYRSRHSESSSSSSSRSSSQSLSPSPIRGRRRRYSRSQSRSFSRSRSRSSSPQADWSRKWRSLKRQREYYHRSLGEDAGRENNQKAIEERRVVYVGKIRSTMTKYELRERFALFGKIEDCTVHFRSRGDNYGFVTYYNTDDAFAAIEKGKKLRQPDELPFDICFGGRRQFCQSNYMDLDSKYDMDPAPSRSKDNTLDFDSLLKQAQRGLKT